MIIVENTPSFDLWYFSSYRKMPLSFFIKPIFLIMPPLSGCIWANYNTSSEVRELFLSFYPNLWLAKYSSSKFAIVSSIYLFSGFIDFLVSLNSLSMYLSDSNELLEKFMLSFTIPSLILETMFFFLAYDMLLGAD